MVTAVTVQDGCYVVKSQAYLWTKSVLGLEVRNDFYLSRYLNGNLLLFPSESMAFSAPWKVM